MESFNGQLRDELLAVEQVGALLEAQVVIEDWSVVYNPPRPRSGLDWLSPAAYTERWNGRQVVGLLSEWTPFRGWSNGVRLLAAPTRPHGRTG